MIEIESKRTIEEVLDLETGEIIKSIDFFKLPDDILIRNRRRQEEARGGFSKPKFVCPFCHQPLKISGKSTKRGSVSFFAHLYDSNECEIKTNGNYSQDEIEAIKYAGIKESQRHIELKEKLYRALTDEKSQELGLHNVEIEKHFASDNPMLKWRRPDVYTELADKKIVFEIQLSTTFLSVIVARDIFYKLNNTYIIWIFNFSANEEYVNLSNLMCKDIYYANKRNAFLFDEEAMKRSELEKELVLACVWFEPLIQNQKIQSGKEIKHVKYIKLSDLKFDEIEYKPYFIDADKLFLDYLPEQLAKRKEIEVEKEEWLRRIEESIFEKIQQKEIEKNEKKKNQEDKIVEIKNGLKEGKYNLKSFQRSEKWGFEVEGEIIINPIYTNIFPFSENGLAKVKRNKKFGFINREGKEVILCEYDEVFEFKFFHCIVRKGKTWMLITSTNEIVRNYDFEKIEVFQTGLPFYKISKVEKIKRYGGKSSTGYRYYVTDIFEKIGLLHFDGTLLCHTIYHEIAQFVNSKSTAIIRNVNYTYNSKKSIDIPEYTDIIGDLIYNEPLLTGFLYFQNPIDPENIYGFKNGFCGVFDSLGNEIIPCIYDKIEKFSNNLAKVIQNGKYGIINQEGNVIIECIYDKLNSFECGIAQGKIGHFYGYIDLNGKEIIPFIYDYIEPPCDEIIKVRKDDLWGFIDLQRNVSIPCIYERIESFEEGRAKVLRNGLWGYIDSNGVEIISIEYDVIEPFQNGKAKAKKNNLWGYINQQGTEFICAKYQDIEDCRNGYYKVKENNKWGYINSSGIIIVKSIYDELGDFFKGFTTIRAKNSIIKVKGLARYQFNNKRGYVDKTGKEYWQYWKDKRDS